MRHEGCLVHPRAGSAGCGFCIYLEFLARETMQKQTPDSCCTQTFPQSWSCWNKFSSSIQARWQNWLNLDNKHYSDLKSKKVNKTPMRWCCECNNKVDITKGRTYHSDKPEPPSFHSKVHLNTVIHPSKMQVGLHHFEAYRQSRAKPTELQGDVLPIPPALSRPFPRVKSSYLGVLRSYCL